MMIEEKISSDFILPKKIQSSMKLAGDWNV